LIILEGADGTGKSSLGVRLSQDLTVAVISHVKPKSLGQYKLLINLAHSLSLSHGIYVMDRHPFISDSIYSSVMDSPRFSQNSDIWDKSSFVIYCRPTTFDIDLRYKAHKPHSELLNVIQNKNGVRDSYDLVVEPLSDFIYNFRREDDYNKLLLALGDRFGLRHNGFSD